MTDDERELCGEECADGTPCENYADSCPWDHGGENDTGRPSKFTDERAQLAIEAAREKKSEAGCARAAGVDENCIGRWKESNPTFEDEDGTNIEFREAFTRARAKGESKLIEHGMYNPDVDASFAKFILASSFDYVETSKQEVEHSGEDGGPIQVNIGGDGK